MLQTSISLLARINAKTVSKDQHSIFEREHRLLRVSVINAKSQSTKLIQ